MAASSVPEVSINEKPILKFNKLGHLQSLLKSSGGGAGGGLRGL